MNSLYKLLTNTKTTEIYSTTKLIIDVFERTVLTTDEYLFGIIVLLKTESVKLNEAIVPIKKRSKLNEKDKIRDEKFRSINHLLKGYIHHPGEEIKFAAKAVYKIFNRYGTGILKKSYATKSSLINSLLLDLSDDALQNDIDALSGLRKLIDELSAAETDFNETWLEHNKLKSAEAKKDSATKIAKGVATIINKKLITYLRAMSQKDNQKYGSFAVTVGRIINENNLMVKKRAKINLDV
ncbi:MAG: DUF6261 family protein [Ignavibacteria bacterium]|jgi:hypothetical protein